MYHSLLIQGVVQPPRCNREWPTSRPRNLAALRTDIRMETPSGLSPRLQVNNHPVDRRQPARSRLLHPGPVVMDRIPFLPMDIRHRRRLFGNVSEQAGAVHRIFVCWNLCMGLFVLLLLSSLLRFDIISLLTIPHLFIPIHPSNLILYIRCSPLASFVPYPLLSLSPLTHLYFTYSPSSKLRSWTTSLQYPLLFSLLVP